MSALDFEPDSARCRIFARNDVPGFEFGAVGSPRFVAASMTGAAIGGVIGTAVRENENFNDCMEARGWRIVDGAPRTAGLVMPVSDATAGQPPVAASTQAPRRDFGVRAEIVTGATAADLHLTPARGVVILAVEPGGAASSAGLLGGDVILTFGGAPVMTIADMQRALADIAPNSTVPATIWRNGYEHPVQIQF